MCIFGKGDKELSAGKPRKHFFIFFEYYVSIQFQKPNVLLKKKNPKPNEMQNHVAVIKRVKVLSHGFMGGSPLYVDMIG